jgi:hypothetical protein
VEPNNLVGILASATVAGILTAFVNGYFNRRKLGADTTKIITDAAAAVVTSTQTRLGLLEQEMGEVRRALRIHEPWDREAVRKLRAANPPIDISEPPPLYPDTTFL